MTQDTWTAGSGDWADAANWSLGAPPGPADQADFAPNGTYTVTGGGAVAGVLLDAGVVTLAGTITQAGDAGLFLAALGAAQLTVAATGTLAGGALALGQGSVLTVDGVLSVSGGTADTVVVGNGQQTGWTDTGTVVVHDFTLEGGAGFAGDVALSDGGVFTQGDFVHDAAATLTVLASATITDTPPPPVAPVTPLDSVMAPPPPLGISRMAIQIASAAGVLSLSGLARHELDGPISGAGALAITNASDSIGGANTYAGGTTLAQATITAMGADPFGSGPIQLQGGSDLTFQDSTGIAPASGPVFSQAGANTVQAGAGQLVGVTAAGSTLTFVGGAGACTAFGGAGVLDASLGSGGGVLVGGSSGQDHLVGGAGPSTLFGGAAGGGLGNQDDFNGASTSRVVMVAAGGNTTLAGGGNSAGNLMFAAATSTTTVQEAPVSFGGLGYGFLGQDTVVGGAGALVVQPDGASLDVFAGAGMLTLAFDAASGVGLPPPGVTNVLGFEAGRDLIDLTGYGVDGVARVLATATHGGGNTELFLGDGTRIALFGVTDLTAASFVTRG